MIRKELFKKILAHIQSASGNENEKANARRIFSRLITEYGFYGIELSEDDINEHAFKYKTKIECMLYAQIIAKVLQRRDACTVRIIRLRRSEWKHIYTNCTNAQALEIETLFEFYKKLWLDEKECLFVAFVHKHNLFADDVVVNEDDVCCEKIEKMKYIIRCLISDAPIRRIGGTNDSGV